MPMCGRSSILSDYAYRGLCVSVGGVCGAGPFGREHAAAAFDAAALQASFTLFGGGAVHRDRAYHSTGHQGGDAVSGLLEIVIPACLPGDSAGLRCTDR